MQVFLQVMQQVVQSKLPQYVQTTKYQSRTNHTVRVTNQFDRSKHENRPYTPTTNTNTTTTSTPPRTTELTVLRTGYSDVEKAEVLAMIAEACVERDGTDSPETFCDKVLLVLLLWVLMVLVLIV